MILLAAEGLSNDEIAHRLDSRREVVCLWRSDSLRNVWRGWKKASARDGPGLFPPEVVVQVKALACELPSGRQQPLSRWSVAEIAAQARRSGLVATISDSTVWRGLTRMPSALATPLLIFHAIRILRPRRGASGSLSSHLAGPAAEPGRVCAVGRQENQHSGAGTLPPNTSVSIGIVGESRTRISTSGGLGLFGGLGCPPSQAVWSMPSPRPGWLPLEGLSTKS